MREQSSAPKEQWTPETEPGPGQPVNGAITPKAPSRMDNLAPDPLPPTTFSPQVAMALDRLFCAHIGNFTGGLDPRVIPLAYLDWWVKLAWSPGTHARLAEKAIRKAVRLGIYMNQTLMDPQSPPAIYPLPQDRRFRSPGWHSWPYNLFHQSFLLTQQWWANATMGVPALSASHKDIVTFVTRQLLDIASPSNFPLTNPEVVEATVREGDEPVAWMGKSIGRLAEAQSWTGGGRIGAV